MPDPQTRQRLRDYQREIVALRKKMHELRKAAAPEPMADYAFLTSDGTVTLSALFADRDHLFVIHNMGRGCVNCTLWADGFNGVLPHLENRSAFVVASPDDPATQQEFAAARGWRFRMVSHRGSSFAADMGYRDDRGFWPGVSVFRKQGGDIVRVSDAAFAPYDDFCTVWHFLGLLPEGAAGWQPKYAYSDEPAKHAAPNQVEGGMR